MTFSRNSKSLGLVVTLKNFHSFPSLGVFFDLSSSTDTGSGVHQNACRLRRLITPYTVLTLPSALTKLLNNTLIFHDFKGPTIKFHLFPGLENEILKFHDFSGFP